MSLVVTGIEPMEGLLKGIEERISKGVSMMPVIYKPWPVSPMGDMQPASAEWYVEMFEKVDEIRSRYGQPTSGAGPIAQSDLVADQSSQQDGQSEDSGPLSANSTIRELLADEKAKAIVEKHQPDFSSHPQIGQAMSMSLKQVASYSQGEITDETLKAIDEDLSKL